MDTFAAVMAAGVLSVDAHVWGETLVSYALGLLALLAFAVLGARNVARLGRLGWRLTAGEPSVDLALVLFTWTAACGVLAERVGALPLVQRTLAALAVVGFVCALAVSAMALRQLVARRRPWEVDGSWLLTAVAWQSVSILASTVAARSGSGAGTAVAVFAWAAGIVCYLALTVLIVTRVATRRVDLADLTPDYWIAMGALAITTVAATDLAAAIGPGAGWLGRAAYAAMAVAWACGTAWIPVLLAMESARLRRRGFAFRYDALRWATVFPLGMFSLATHDVGSALGVPLLAPVSVAFLWAGVVVAAMNLAAVVHARLTVAARQA